ncbi:PLDc N-terminal domain-containing protein [Salipaludibacillus sp. HK11]|uniref:PLDc N-terminal domain-containing protein n=1 Tax=Salipaludibacillus sp. HK11 TaxID=3394320 RepID=UPI0039FB9128
MLELSSFLFFILLISVGIFLLNIITSIWSYRDSLRRGNSREFSILVLVITLFFPIVGLIIYLVIRKDV